MIVGIDHADPRPDLAIEFAQLSTWTYPQLADPDVVLRAELQITVRPRPSSSAQTAPSPIVTLDRSARRKRSATWRSKHLGVTP